MENLRTAGLLFDQICQASQELNSVFSFQILVLLATNSAIITSQLFFLVCNVSIRPVFGIDMISRHVINILLHTVIIVIVLTAADLPVTEVSFEFSARKTFQKL